MLKLTKNGIYCSKGDFYIDPIRPVKHAVITHGHADHARWGMDHYIATPATCDIMKARISEDINATKLNYNHDMTIGDVTIKLVPAGHILGSAQVVINDSESTAVVTGDFKTTADSTVDKFEYVNCDLLVMETTFALPIYHWPESSEIFNQIHSFWQQNQQDGYHTVLYAYSLGKAQRLLAGINANNGPIAVHGAVDKMNQIYAKYDRLNVVPPTLTKDVIESWQLPGLVVAPPATIGSAWLKKLGKYREAYVSGWMLSKGQTRRRNMRGFVLSDHADWNGLNDTVAKCQPDQVWTMHGYTDIYAKYLSQKGIHAKSLSELMLERSE